MGFPVVQTRSSGIQGSNSQTHAITLPAGIAVGDLLLLIFSSDGTPICSTTSSGWNKLGQASYTTTSPTAAIFYKFATGSDACTIDTTASEQSTHVCLRISGAGTPNIGTASTGDGTNSDPPSVTGSASLDHLWVATRSGDGATVATVAPTYYGDLQTKAGGTSGASTNSAERSLNAQTENPGIFTSATEQWVCYTVAVPPIPAITGTGAMSGRCPREEGTAKVRFLGTAAVVAAAAIMATAGILRFGGIGAVAGPSAAVAESGRQTFSGSVVQAGGLGSPAGVGVVQNPAPPEISGEGVTASFAASLAGQGKQVFEAGGATRSPSTALSGLAVERFTGSGRLSARPAGPALQAALNFSGTAAAASALGTVSGSATEIFRGSGMSGSGIPLEEVTGTVSGGQYPAPIWGEAVVPVPILASTGIGKTGLAPGRRRARGTGAELRFPVRTKRLVVHQKVYGSGASALAPIHAQATGSLVIAGRARVSVARVTALGEGRQCFGGGGKADMFVPEATGIGSMNDDDIVVALWFLKEAGR